MAWTTPGTAVAGEVLEAAFWNANVRDGLNAIRAAQINIQQTVFPTALANTGQASGAFADLGFDCSITPSSDTSKILVIAAVSISSTTGSQGVRFRLYRNGSHLTAASGNTSGNRTTAWISGQSSSTNNMQMVSGMYLDSPASTSEQTYALYGGHTRGTTDDWYINRIYTDNDLSSTTRQVSTLTLIEVPV